MRSLWFPTILLYTLSLILFSCGGSEHQKVNPSELGKYKEPLLKANKYLSRKEDEQIKAYIKRRNWPMEVSDRGMYYMIYEKVDSTYKKAMPGKLVTFSYELSLLNGKLCYSSDSLGPKSFVMSKSNVISGLEEGISMMREGEKARFIIPPYLAWGLLGDEDKVPMRSIVVYDVELISVEDLYYD